jgi:hypothetical protein
MPTDAICCQRMSAGHDRNGNPRRLWIAYARPTSSLMPLLAVWDVGCEGKPDELEGVPELLEVTVSAGEYRATRALARNAGTLR